MHIDMLPERANVDAGAVYNHMVDAMSFAKLHRCTSSYCLRHLRHVPAQMAAGVTGGSYRECSKAGCGPEAPLVNHNMSGKMRPEGAAADVAESFLCGRAVSYDAQTRCYKVRLDERDVALAGANGRMFICRLDDARPALAAEDGRVRALKPEAFAALDPTEYFCRDVRCPGKWTKRDGESGIDRVSYCDRCPPMGKMRRTEPAIVDNKETGIPSIELPRVHPRFVQGCVVVTEWWQANDDQRVILCRAAPEACTPDDLANVARYVPGYMCKGTDGSAEYAAVFRRLIESVDEDATIKKLVRQLLIRMIGKDFPRQQVLYLLAGDCTHSRDLKFGRLRATNVTFAPASLKNVRALNTRNKGGASVSSNALDRYEQWRASPAGKCISLYQFLQRRPSSKNRTVVPLIGGGQLWYTDPPSDAYCHNMLKLHRPWTKRSDVPEGDAAIATFKSWIDNGDAPRALQVEIAKAKSGKPSSAYEGAAEEFEYEEDPPEWADLLGNAAFVDSTDFEHDDFTSRGAAHDHSIAYDECLGAKIQKLVSPGAVEMWWQQQTADAEAERQNNPQLGLANLNPNDANGMQKRAIALLLHALHCHIEGWSLVPGVDTTPPRLLLLGRPGAGKSFVLKIMSTLTRMVTGQRDSALVGAPTGVAAFISGGSTWHTLLSIKPGHMFKKALADEGGLATVQDRLRFLKALLGDEVSLTGRTLLGWVGHRVRTNVANGAAGSLDDITGGEHLPFWAEAGDFYQLPPTLDTILYNTEHRNANSNFGAAVFKMFDDVIELDSVVRQDESETELLSLLEAMRTGAEPDAYDMAFVNSRHLSKLPPAERELFNLPGQRTLWCAPTKEEAWRTRNYPVLGMLNRGYTSSKGDVSAVPVYKVFAQNKGTHAKQSAGTEFGSLPPAGYLARRLQVRLTANLYGHLGQKWGLVNGKIGHVIDIIFAKDAPPSAANSKAMPLVVVVHFPDYIGPVWIEGHAKVVPIVPVERPGDCRCRCTRIMIPLSVAEGATIHSLQGMTISQSCGEDPPCQVCEDESHKGRCAIARLGINFGEKKLESNAGFRGAALVAQSRPKSKRDFAYTSPVGLDRLAVCGKGDAYVKLRAAMAAFRRRAQACEPKMRALEEHFDKLLDWAVSKRAARRNIAAPWDAPVVDAASGAQDEPRIGAPSDPVIGSGPDEPLGGTRSTPMDELDDVSDADPSPRPPPPPPSSPPRPPPPPPMSPPLSVGSTVWYDGREGRVQATIVGVHYEDLPPYYTISIDGEERATVRAIASVLEHV